MDSSLHQERFLTKGKNLCAYKHHVSLMLKSSETVVTSKSQMIRLISLILTCANVREASKETVLPGSRHCYHFFHAIL